jgi:branched-chain amino acid transport system ATP-binding protein
MSNEVLRIEGLSKKFGGIKAIDNVAFNVCKSEIHAVIGPNGAGKTTFISLMSGELSPDAGSIIFEGRNINGLSVPKRARVGLGRSYQISQIFRDMSALQNVMIAVQSATGNSYSFLRPASADMKVMNRAIELLETVGLAERGKAMVAEMAHGEHRQLELAMTLASDPHLLLLDEPMAGMSQAESGEMVKLLKQIRSNYAVILVEHDMDAVFALADRISVLVYGKIIATGTPEEIRRDPNVREAYLGEDEVGFV